MFWTDLLGPMYVSTMFLGWARVPTLLLLWLSLSYKTLNLTGYVNGMDFPYRDIVPRIHDKPRSDLL